MLKPQLLNCVLHPDLHPAIRDVPTQQPPRPRTRDENIGAYAGLPRRPRVLHAQVVVDLPLGLQAAGGGAGGADGVEDGGGGGAEGGGDHGGPLGGVGFEGGGKLRGLCGGEAPGYGLDGGEDVGSEEGGEDVAADGAGAAEYGGRGHFVM